MNKSNSYSEVRVHKMLDHKHIIKLHHYFEDDEFGYLLL